MPISDIHRPPPYPGNTLIRNVTVVRSEGLHVGCDILIERGKIKEVGPALKIPENEHAQRPFLVVDAQDALALPGALDMHVHFRTPSLNKAEDLVSGSIAAAAGGVTGFADMPNTHPLTMPGDRFEDKMELAEGRCRTDYSFYVTLDPRADVRALSEVDPERVPGFKAFLGGTTAAEALDDADFAAICLAAKEHGLPITVHAEEDAILAENAAWLQRRGVVPETEPNYHAEYRDAVACTASTCRALRAARRYDIHLHIAHVTTAAEVELIRAAKRSGVRVTAEVTLHHLWFAADAEDAECYVKHGHEVKCNPSIKYRRDQMALWEGLLDGTIDMIGTDHAPHPRKPVDYAKAPSGVASAVEYVLPLLVSECQNNHIYGPNLGLALTNVVEWTCLKPAQLFGVQNKGGIFPGMDGDVVLIPTEQRERARPVLALRHHSPWEREELDTWPSATFLRGSLVYRDHDLPLVTDQPIEVRQGSGFPLDFAYDRT